MTAAAVKQEEFSKMTMSHLVNVSTENYKWAKDWVAQNKTLGSRVSPLIEFTEEQTLTLLKKNNVNVEEVISAVDAKVEQAIEYTAKTVIQAGEYTSETVKQVREAPAKLTSSTLAMVHENLKKLRVEQGEEEGSEEVTVSKIAEDAKSITAERLNQLLDASEGYLAQYLPISDDDKKEMKVEGAKGELKPLAVRATKQGRLAAKRLQEQAFNNLQGLKMRTDKVVHVDLVKYSEFLDKQKDNALQTIYLTLEKFDEKVVKPTKEAAAEGVKVVEERVSEGVKVVGERVITPAKQRIVSVELPFRDSIVHVWTVVGDEYNHRVVQPRDQIVQMFREELALQQELAKQKSGEDLTVTAGLNAVVAAARARLSKEWEVRISPTLAKIWKTAEQLDEEEEAELKSLGDDAEEGDVENDDETSE